MTRRRGRRRRRMRRSGRLAARGDDADVPGAGGDVAGGEEVVHEGHRAGSRAGASSRTRGGGRGRGGRMASVGEGRLRVGELAREAAHGVGAAASGARGWAGRGFTVTRGGRDPGDRRAGGCGGRASPAECEELGARRDDRRGAAVAGRRARGEGLEGLARGVRARGRSAAGARGRGGGARRGGCASLSRRNNRKRHRSNGDRGINRGKRKARSTSASAC